MTTATDTPAAILVDREIRRLLAEGIIRARTDVQPRQIQPASLDLRLGSRVHRVRCGFLTESSTVREGLDELTLYTFDIEDGGVLECGQIYFIELQEFLALPAELRARSNPKSTTGRLDIFTRLVTDRTGRFDDVPAGYAGPLFLEVSPRSFPIRVRTGDCLNQIRFATHGRALSRRDLERIYDATPLAYDPAGKPIPREGMSFDEDGSLTFGIGLPREGVVGYRAKRHGGVIDLRAIGRHEPEPFFDPVVAPGGRVVIEPEMFYIFASRERVCVPRDHAAEMVAYDVGIGELRTNYAGFFDNGFGAHTEGTRGTPAILEVRAHDVPFLIEDGQPVFRLKYFRTDSTPDALYGECGSSYAHQTLDLAKQFRR